MQAPAAGLLQACPSSPNPKTPSLLPAFGVAAPAQQLHVSDIWQERKSACQTTALPSVPAAPSPW